MRELWPQFQNVPFGGRDIIFAGDPGQLNPVSPFSLTTPPRLLRHSVQKQGRSIWESISHVCCLRTQKRGEENPEWFAALRRLRSINSSPKDLKLFNSRILEGEHTKQWSDATYLAYTNDTVNETNDKCLQEQQNPIVHIQAKHSVVAKYLRLSQPIDTSTIDSLLIRAEQRERDRDRIVSPQLDLAVGAPVTITFNLEQRAGLCNGAKAKVYDFMPKEHSPIPILLVQITDKYIGPSFLEGTPNIVPRMISWSEPDHPDVKMTTTEPPTSTELSHTSEETADKSPGKEQQQPQKKQKK